MTKRAPIVTCSPLIWLALTASVILVLAGCDMGSGGPQTSATATPSAATSSATATPLVVDGVAYTRYTDPTFDFSLEIPSVLTINGIQPNPSDGGGVTAWSATSPTAQDAPALYIATATKDVDPRICQMGTPIIIGPGLKGYQQDIFAASTPPPMPNSGAPSNAQVSASVVENGVWVSLNLVGAPPADTFMRRYGSIWHEMLSSFMPGTVTSSNNPCAG